MQTRPFGTIRHRCLRHRPRHVGHRGLDVGRRRRTRLHRGHPGVHRRGRDAHRHGPRVRLRALRGDRGQGHRGPPGRGRAVHEVRAGLGHRPRRALLRRRGPRRPSLPRQRLDRPRDRGQPAPPGHRRHRHLRDALAGPHDAHRGDDGGARGPQGRRQDPGHRGQQRDPGRRRPSTSRRVGSTASRSATTRWTASSRPSSSRSASSAASRSCRTPRWRWASCRARWRPSASSRATTSARTNPRYSPENRARRGRDAAPARSTLRGARRHDGAARHRLDAGSTRHHLRALRRPDAGACRGERQGRDRCELSADAIAAVDAVFDAHVPDLA